MTVAVETTFTGYIVVQFADETTRKYEIEMFADGVDAMKGRVIALNNSMTTDPRTFSRTFLSSSEDTETLADRMATKIIEAGFTKTDSEIVYSAN